MRTEAAASVEAGAWQLPASDQSPARSDLLGPQCLLDHDDTGMADEVPYGGTQRLRMSSQEPRTPSREGPERCLGAGADQHADGRMRSASCRPARVSPPFIVAPPPMPVQDTVRTTLHRRRLYGDRQCRHEEASDAPVGTAKEIEYLLTLHVPRLPTAPPPRLTPRIAARHRSRQRRGAISQR